MPSPPTETILIVDDSEDFRDTLADLLTMQGYRVSCAANGREALEQLRGGPLPRLILLDLKMPRMNGWDFREEQLRDPELAGIPVIILSGGADIPEETDGLGAAGYLPKPVDVSVLLSAIAPYFE
jgi:CheY-like chemotaxis protein